MAQEPVAGKTQTAHHTTLGVDPGTIITGYAALADDQPPIFIEHGTIRSRDRDPLPERLKRLRDRLSEIIHRLQPDIIAIENPFVGKNARTSLAVGQAQAAVMIAAADHGLPVATYPPSKVKQHAAGAGSASKDQVRVLVAAELGIPQPATNDEADALAVALCHLNDRRARHALERQIATGAPAPAQGAKSDTESAIGGAARRAPKPARRPSQGPGGRGHPVRRKPPGAG